MSSDSSSNTEVLKKDIRKKTFVKKQKCKLHKYFFYVIVIKILFLAPTYCTKRNKPRSCLQSKLKIQVGKPTSISKIERRERQNAFEADIENEVENDSLELMNDEQLLGNHETLFSNYLVHICA